MNYGEQLAAFRKMVAAMSDRELAAFLDRFSHSMPATKMEKAQLTIPDDILRQYQDLNTLLSDPIRSATVDAEQRRWLRAIRQLKVLSVQRPIFYDSLTDELIFQRLKQVCAANLLPDDVIEKILPSLMGFIHTGQMERPIMFVGAKGCGKTTAAKIVIEAVLGLPAFVCSASDSYGRGLSGKSVTWRGATYGMIFDACVKSNSLNPGIIIDEIDKTPHDPNEPSIENILLSICDDRREVEENFLGMALPTRYMPIFLTGNDMERISEPLRDRCMIFEYPDASVQQVFSICKKYCEQLMVKNNYARRVILDESILHEGIQRLYSYEHSIRQHKKMIDSVLGKANIHSLESGGKAVRVSLEAFENDIAHGDARSGKRIGFD